jgi:hypothetical protein
MKRIIILLAVVGMFGFQGCSGPEGPPGPPGFDGQDGQDGLIAEVFEANASFTQANGYAVTFQLNPVIYSGDTILVYELVNTNDGIKTWALLPQVYYFTAGTAQYNYNFSYDQFTIFIDASFGLDLLPTSFTLGKTFRIVIVPGDDGINSKKSSNKADFSDYNAVIKKYSIDDSNVKKLN